MLHSYQRCADAVKPRPTEVIVRDASRRLPVNGSKASKAPLQRSPRIRPRDPKAGSWSSGGHAILRGAFIGRVRASFWDNLDSAQRPRSLTSSSSGSYGNQSSIRPVSMCVGRSGRSGLRPVETSAGRELPGGSVKPLPLGADRKG